MSFLAQLAPQRQRLLKPNLGAGIVALQLGQGAGTQVGRRPGRARSAGAAPHGVFEPAPPLAIVGAHEPKRDQAIN